MLRICFLALLSAALPCAAQHEHWNDPFPPYRIAGNLYYVGARDLASYLVVTPQGDILINSGFERTVPVIRSNVERLGFRFSDIKILLASHAHDDHLEGHALVRELTGARVFVMQGDERVVQTGGEGQYLYRGRWKPCRVDHVLHDGEQVRLGNAVLTAHLTPGHTRGCTTWTMQVSERGRTYDVVIVGSPNVNTGYRLVGNTEYPEIADDFARTFRVLKALHCDIFLGAHGVYFGMLSKYARLKDGGANPFLDPQGYRAYIAERESAFRKTLAGQKNEKQ